MERVTKTFIFRDKKYSKRIYAVIATSLSDARTAMVGRGTLIKEDKNQDINPSIAITTNKAQLAIRELNNRLFCTENDN